MAREVLLINPRARRTTRRRKPATAAARRRRRNPVTARRRAAPVRRRRTAVKRRRNPISARSVMRRMQPRGLMNTAMSAIPPAAGAVLLDVGWNFLPIPANLKTGNLRYLAKGLGAVLLGEVAKAVVSKKTADSFTMGALTVVMYEAGRELVANVVPGAALGYYSAGMPVGALGEYLSPNSTSFPLGQNAWPARQMPCAGDGNGVGEYLSGDYYD